MFTYLVSLSVVTVAIPYFFSACAQLAYLVSRRRRVNGWALTRDLAIATASILFSLWVTIAAGYQAVYQAMLLLLIGIPIYAFLKARRERRGQAVEPVEISDQPNSGGASVPLGSWRAKQTVPASLIGDCLERRKVGRLPVKEQQ